VAPCQDVTAHEVDLIIRKFTLLGVSALQHRNIPATVCSSHYPQFNNAQQRTKNAHQKLLRYQYNMLLNICITPDVKLTINIAPSLDFYPGNSQTFSQFPYSCYQIPGDISTFSRQMTCSYYSRMSPRSSLLPTKDTVVERHVHYSTNCDSGIYIIYNWST